MNKMLAATKGKYFLKLGNHTLSPVLEASTVLGLDYCEKISSNKLDILSPTFFAFLIKNQLPFGYLLQYLPTIF